ncbi:MAG: hypothetical protein FJ297_18810 [Planctomycetes bacterium]|nr:hypothetical protein [Planctomycetota bacterium]
MLFTTIFQLIMLVCLWRIGDVAFAAKVFLTLASIAVWALILWNPAALIVAQCVLIAVIGAATFGVEWLNQRIP